MACLGHESPPGLSIGRGLLLEGRRRVDRAKTVNTPKDFFAVEPLLCDPRLSPAIVMDHLLTCADEFARTHTKFFFGDTDRPGQMYWIELATRTMEQRPDLSADDRQVLLRTMDFMMNPVRFGSVAAQARVMQAAQHWRRSDVEPELVTGHGRSRLTSDVEHRPRIWSSGTDPLGG
jgi:hypothetical protein